MATPFVVASAAQLTLNWSGATRTWQNVIGCRALNTMPTVDQALAETLFTGIRGSANFTALMALMAPTVIFESIGIRSLNTPNQAKFTSTGTPLAGGGTGDMLPLSTAAVVTIRTALAGKSFRGRVYFSGFDEAQNDANGRSVAGVNTACSGAMVAVNSILAQNGLTVAVISRPRAGVTIPAVTRPAVTGGATPVSAFDTRNTKWESQRRRTGRS